MIIASSSGANIPLKDIDYLPPVGESVIYSSKRPLPLRADDFCMLGARLDFFEFIQSALDFRGNIAGHGKRRMRLEMMGEFWVTHLLPDQSGQAPLFRLLLHARQPGEHEMVPKYFARYVYDNFREPGECGKSQPS